MVVLKFGGSVLSSLAKIREVASHIAKRKKAGEAICVVVSAIGGTTDRLHKFALAFTQNPPKRELDMLLTVGERISASLLSIALGDLGVKALSLTGSQVGIITDATHTDARIYEIKGGHLKQCLRRDIIPVVAGFQGVSYKKEITTLGRGGSDITAVALAAFLRAKRCEIYKDVSGIYTEDPKEFKNLNQIQELSYEEGLELTSSGSEILHPRALALANKYNIEIVVRSLKNSGGTMIREKKEVEKANVLALTHRKNLVRFTLLSVPKVSRCLSQVVSQLAINKIPLLFFAHGVPYHNRFDLSFILKQSEERVAQGVLLRLKEKVKGEKLEVKRDIGSISLIGPQVGTDLEILKTVFDCFQKEGIHIDAFTTTATNITLYLKKKDIRKGIQRLLRKFRLKR